MASVETQDHQVNGAFNGANHQVKNIDQASSLAEIQTTLNQLNEHEASVTAKLNVLLASQKDLSSQLNRLDLLRANLGTQVVATRAISNGMLSSAAVTAHRISRAVKRLDQEQSNVKATLSVVEQVAELKACVLGVHGSMAGQGQDWETAASYLSKARQIPVDVVESNFAEEIVPTAEVPDPPKVTLEGASEALCKLFLREFEAATSDGDGARVTRFFKLFPLIGKSEVGLDAYSRYVCTGVAARARQNLDVRAKEDSYFYANALTRLFEHIAQIVDGHAPLVERHYGEGRMGRVIERLQVEADVQGGILLDTWSDERQIDRKLTDVKSYAFSFLVQSYLPTQKASAGTPRSSSPAKKGETIGRVSEDEGVDMKEIDAILGQIALMAGRWALYTRFLASKHGGLQLDRNGKEILTIPDFVLNSNLQKKASKTLILCFNEMTTFFFRRSVEKAFQLDESPSDLTLNVNKPLGANPPFMTSAVDEVMYIVNHTLQRSIATSQRAVVTTVIPTIGRVLGADFVGMIQRKMRDESYPKAAIAGALPPEDKTIQFLVLLNNLDIANGYFKRIIATHLRSGTATEGSNEPSSPSLADRFPFDNDAQILETQLKNMEHSFTGKTGELINDGIQVLFHQIIKPRMRPILADTFRDIDYAPESETSGNADPAEDNGEDNQELLVRNRFDRVWNSLMRPLKRILTDANFAKLLETSVGYLARSLEKRIWSYHGRVSELGAVRLERDVAGIVAVAVGGGRYELRDQFAKCVQICLVMNMEDDEWDELVEAEREGMGEDDGMNWVLDSGERRRARAIVSS